MDQSLHSSCHHFNYKISHSLSLQNSRRRKKITRALKKARENPYNSLKNTSSSLLFSPPFSQRPQGSIYRPQRMRPSNLSRGIKRWLNGQILAADLRPEPRFRGRILAVAPTISVVVLLQSIGHVGSSRRLGIFVDAPDLGLTFGFSFWLLINPINSLIIP